MFDKNDKEVAGSGTVIGANVKLVGALRDRHDIVVHGAIEGEVASEKNVSIGETAQVKGPLSGETITIAGTIHGSVEARERLEILATGKVYGDITVKDLVIRSGAIFVGKSNMAEREQTVNAKSADKPASASAQPRAKAEYEVE